MCFFFRTLPINNKDMKKLTLSILLTLSLFVFFPVYAEDVKIVIPTTMDTNYALYPVSTGVYLRFDTRDGTIIGIVPSKPKTNRILNSQALAKDNKAGRFQLYPTDNVWELLLFDSTTGDVWLLKWSDKKDILIKIHIED